MTRTLLALLALAFAAGAQAQAWPSKPFRVIATYPPGGGIDFVARTVGQRMTEVLKQPVVVENKTGASGTIGADAAAKAPPDGYTFLVASPAEVLVGPISGQKTPYDPARDLVPVTLAGETPLGIAAHPSLAAKTLPELIALAKAQPGKLAYATSGGGSTMHYAGESLNAIAGIDLQHVPYRGAGPAVTDLLGGQILLGIFGMSPLVPHAKSGKLRILAVTSDKRSSAMPEIPTVAELPGFAGYRFTNWFAVFLPAKTPPAIVERLALEIGKILREPEIRAKLLASGIEPVGNSPAEFAAFLETERKTYSKIAKERGIRAEE